MKYNAKYDRWVTKGGLVYRYDKKKDRLVLANQVCVKGYLIHYIRKGNKRIHVSVHRLVWETFNGEIPQGYEIDHINTIKYDNRLENLRCVTPKENHNNPLTRKHISAAQRGKTLTAAHKDKIGESLKGKTHTDFGRKFKEHFNTTFKDNPTLYNKEYSWYTKHNKVCRWEVEDK